MPECLPERFCPRIAPAIVFARAQYPGEQSQSAFSVDVRGYAMRPIRRGGASVRPAMPGTVRCSAICAAGAVTSSRLMALDGVVVAQGQAHIAPSPWQASNFRLVKFALRARFLPSLAARPEVFRYERLAAGAVLFATVNSRVLKKM